MCARERNKQQDENLLVSEIYENYGKILKKLAISRGVTPDDVEDLVQDSIIAYYLNYDLNMPEDKKLALLGRILINKSTDLYRKKSHYETVELNSDEDEAGLLVDHILTDDALQYVMRDEAYRAVRDCILGMKKIWRDVTILHMVEGRPECEVARMLGITETTCRARISRARKYLREVLGDWFRD